MKADSLIQQIFTESYLILDHVLRNLQSTGKDEIYKQIIRIYSLLYGSTAMGKAILNKQINRWDLINSSQKN